MTLNAKPQYRVLVVDSEIVLCELIKDTLLESDYIANSAYNAEDAIMDFTVQKIGGAPYNMVILDIGKDESNSMGAILPVIREIDPNVRIILTSDDEYQLSQIDDRELEVTAKLAKPFGTKTLLEAVSTAATGKAV